MQRVAPIENSMLLNNSRGGFMNGGKSANYLPSYEEIYKQNQPLRRDFTMEGEFEQEQTDMDDDSIHNRRGGPILDA